MCETVENKKRGRGRPRSFNESEALDSAVRLFWTKGYDATSLDDLSEAMGIGRPSMYGAFGDKEALFLRCLQHFAETVSSRPMATLESTANIHEAVFGFLKGTADYATGDCNHVGCLYGSVAGAVDLPSVRGFLAASLQRRQTKVQNRLSQAVKAGHLPANFPVEQRARRTMNAVMAIASRARLGASLDELTQDAEDATATILSPFAH